MKQPVFLFFFLFFSAALAAQTNAEKLEQAVKIYNSLRDYEDGLTPGSVKTSDIDHIKEETAKAKPLLDDVVASGSAEESKTARYFRANFQYELGFVLGMMGKNQEAYTTLSVIKADFEFFSDPKQFPLRYVFDGKNYSIAFDNFGPTLAEYYTGMGEICANLGKTQESLSWSRMGYSFSYTTEWYKYIAAAKIIEQKKKLDEYDQEMADMAMSQLKLYNRMDTSYKRTIRENAYPSPESFYKTMNSVLNEKPELSKGGAYYAEAAPEFEKAGHNSKAADFYNRAVQAGYRSSTFSDQLIQFAKKTADDELGSKGCEMKESFLTDSDCAGWSQLAADWERFGNSAKSKAAKAKASTCEKKTQQKEKRVRSGRAFGIYAAIYPGPMLCRYSRYRDYGGTFGIVFSERFMMEFGYRKINSNLVFWEDISFKGENPPKDRLYWDGFKAHFAMKFHAKNASDGFFVGPYFGYVSKIMQPFGSMVTNNATGLSYTRDFTATEKSYEAMVNLGMCMTTKHFYYEFFMGAGAAYYQFRTDASEFGNSDYTFSYSLLQYRKADRIGPVLRMGLAIGISTLQNFWN